MSVPDLADKRRFLAHLQLLIAVHRGLSMEKQNTPCATVAPHASSAGPRKVIEIFGVRPLILSISDDEMLRNTRHMLLDRACLTVISATSRDNLPEVLERRADAVLICHSVELGQAELIADRLSRIKPELIIRRLVLWHEASGNRIEEIQAALPASLIGQIKMLLTSSPNSDNVAIR